MVRLVHLMMDNALFLGIISFLLIMVPIVGIAIVNDPD
jgi:predicted PurR-regulated permease PerM